MLTKKCPNYFDESYLPLEINGVHTRLSYQKLNVLRRKTNVEQKPYLTFAPLWNNLNKTLNISTSLNAFMHNIKQHYFIELEKKES